MPYQWKWEKKGENKGEKDKTSIGKAARTPRVLARLDALKTRNNIVKKVVQNSNKAINYNPWPERRN
jgi:hypothetical protein